MSRHVQKIELFDRQGQRKYLNADERAAFERAARQEARSCRRALALTLLHSGCRISEALNLTRASLDMAEGTLIIRTLKQRGLIKYRSVPVPRSLLSLLEQISCGKSDDDRIWDICRSTAYLTIVSTSKAADLSGAKASPKGLRHAFATACISKNIPLPTLQKWLGHSRLESTAIYLQLSTKDERDFARRLWKSSD